MAATDDHSDVEEDASQLNSSQPESMLASSPFASSPPRGPPKYGTNGRKERRQPSITPRKFKKFFTPRSHGTMGGDSRHALHDITRPANNRNGVQSSPLRPFADLTRSNGPVHSSNKRRKLVHQADDLASNNSNPDRTEAIEEEALATQDEEEHEAGNIHSSPCVRKNKVDQDLHYSSESEDEAPESSVKRCVPTASRGLNGRLMQMSLGSYSTPRRQRFVYPINDWRDETENFYSTPLDVHFCASIVNNNRCIPFCTTGLNTNNLVAIGDEEGRVRLIDSSAPMFKSVLLAFRPHRNAIIDMAFTHDDTSLATASGDQKAMVTDMTTQTTVAVLYRHSASVKQIRWQSGQANKSVLATCSRDGSVHIWDLRCKPSSGPVIQVERGPGDRNPRTLKDIIVNTQPNHSIYGAHNTERSHVNLMRDTPSRHEHAIRAGDVSVTALAFLPSGQENFFITSSEANASVKLWDIRTLHQSRRRPHTPISYTALPEAHNQWRHFGLSSMVLSSDGGRLYTVCKDNSVYAYSTAHLIIGHAPELSSKKTVWPGRSHVSSVQGLGPIYGFRHALLHATSFYVKSALRPAKDGKSEILAVGSSDGTPILFPTDERYHKYEYPGHRQGGMEGLGYNVGMGPRVIPQLRRTASGSTVRVEDVPISMVGTPLAQGHDREVGALTWTSEGQLITVGDDFLVRRWREGPDAAIVRERGMASAQVDYDDDDDDDEA